MARVFVSHRGADASEARRLAEELRHRGHDVWLDSWVIDVGDSIVEQMNEGLSRSSYLVLCYSSNGTITPWMSREWMSTLARQLSGEKVTLLPVLLTGNGKPPAILWDIKFANLAADWQRGIDALCASIV